MAAALPLLLLVHALGAAANVTYCWGSGSAGQLGDGQGGGSHSQPVPVAVASAPELATVSAGAQHTCGLTAAGQAYCWGQAVNGELGVGDVNGTYLATPAPVAGNLTFTGLALGEKFTCGIAGSKAYCWGSGESGRLGTGSNTSSDVPVEVAGNRTFASIALGQAHACALTPEGQAWCWGENFFGQLGNNSTTSSAVPVKVPGKHNFLAVAAGDHHTCALLAVTRQPMCWGSNAWGQLGSIGPPLAATPTAVANDPSSGEAMVFALLASGSKFSCGNIIHSFGRTYMYGVYCWGENDRGQLGLNLDDDFSSTPVRLPGTQRFASISAGRAHACGVDSQAAAFCWGAGMDGQLGTGTQGRVAQYDDYTSTTPLPVAQEGGSTIPFYSVSAGGRHTCGVSPRAAAGPSPSPAAADALPPGTAAVPPVLSPNLSPAAAPSPSPAASPGANSSSAAQQQSSSSLPVGAVVGAVVGAAAVAVLAFFALRPRKGWLRKRGTASASFVDSECGLKDSSLKLSLSDKALFSSLPAGVLDSFLPAVGAKQSQAAALAAAPQPGDFIPANAPDSSGGAQDPLLAYISSYLTSHPSARCASRGAAPQLGSGSSGGGASRTSSTGQALSPEAHMWQLQWDELEVERQVGRGSFGTVYRARWHETPVAVKLLIDPGTPLHSSGLELPDDTMRELEAEAAVMIRMRHPNVVQFMGLCQLPPALVTEYCARGSLYDCLHAARTNPTSAAELTWTRRLGMAIDAGTGLLYLHSRNIVHRDVKSPNYLVTDSWAVKASDFNLSRLLGEAGVPVLSTGGPSNPIWLAPELLRGGHATTSSDVFSFGVVLWEMLTWRLPWAGSKLSPFQIGAKVVAGERLEVPPREALPGPDTATFGGLDAYCELLQECWAGQPEQRPGMAQVVRRLRALLEACGGGGAGQVAGGGGAS